MATTSAPIMPPAPARLSGITLTPSDSVKACAMVRPAMSAKPAVAKGMTMRIGLSGQVCAKACAQRHGMSSKHKRNFRMSIMLIPFVFDYNAAGAGVQSVITGLHLLHLQHLLHLLDVP